MLRRPFESAQYTSLAFGQRCREAGVRPSMGSLGDCFDNAMCESFFATLECELLDRRRFKTQSEARMAVFEFIEGWYNPHRRHSALDYLSPINYEWSQQTESLTASPTPSIGPSKRGSSTYVTAADSKRDDRGGQSHKQDSGRLH